MPPAAGRAPAISPAAPVAQAGPATPEAARVAAEAARIVANVRTAVYSHSTKTDEAAGVYELDCSGLVRYVLRRTSPGHLAAVVAETAETSTLPRAVEFYSVFKARLDTGLPRGGWAAVPRLLDARPGDIIAWRLPVALPGNSGHIVIVAATPVAEPDGSVRVVVIDSTTTPHDSDTRAPGATGVGSGTMWFRVDAAGAPVAYRRNSSLTFHEQQTSIGRLTALTSTQ
jgi:hypothetical protein